MPENAMDNARPTRRLATCINNLAYLGESREDLRERRAAGETLISLTMGREYEIVGEDKRMNMYDVIDDSGESYLYPKPYFRLLD